MCGNRLGLFGFIISIIFTFSTSELSARCKQFADLAESSLSRKGSKEVAKNVQQQIENGLRAGNKKFDRRTRTATARDKLADIQGRAINSRPLTPLQQLRLRRLYKAVSRAIRKRSPEALQNINLTGELAAKLKIPEAVFQQAVDSNLVSSSLGYGLYRLKKPIILSLILGTGGYVGHEVLQNHYPAQVKQFDSQAADIFDKALTEVQARAPEIWESALGESKVIIQKIRAVDLRDGHEGFRSLTGDQWGSSR